jgi:hypothetical protein
LIAYLALSTKDRCVPAAASSGTVDVDGRAGIAADVASTDEHGAKDVESLFRQE